MHTCSLIPRTAKKVFTVEEETLICHEALMDPCDFPYSLSKAYIKTLTYGIEQLMGRLCPYHDSEKGSYVLPRSPWHRGLENAY